MSAGDNTLYFELELPATLDAWELAQARAVIHNASTQPILPVELRLSSAAGIVESWGIEGRITYWGQRVQGRKTRQGWEVLLDPLPETGQVALPADAQAQEASDALVRLEPLLPGATETLVASFEAAYTHGDQLDATLRYLVLDPQVRQIYTVREEPPQRALVRAEPVDRLQFTEGSNYYLPLEELAAHLQTLEVSQRFTIQHPDFDLDQARQRAGVAAGPFAYEPASGHWILVNAQHSRTVRVGASGPIQKLPGNWLDVLLALQRYTTVDIYWQTATAEEAMRISALLAAAGMRAANYTHKGYVDATLLVITLDSSRSLHLGRVIEAVGKRLNDFRVEGS
jgi:uncharacterized protein YfiM (DUF2279 family)